MGDLPSRCHLQHAHPPLMWLWALAYLGTAVARTNVAGAPSVLSLGPWVHMEGMCLLTSDPLWDLADRGSFYHRP